VVWKSLEAGSSDSSDSEVEEPFEDASPRLAVGDYNGRETRCVGGQTTNRASVRHRSVLREFGAGHKFYAVRRGRTPGLYFSWADCSRQVTCHKGAEYKSFRTLVEAEEYLFRGGSF
jgi:hypothetical protein